MNEGWEEQRTSLEREKRYRRRGQNEKAKPYLANFFNPWSESNGTPSIAAEPLDPSPGTVSNLVDQKDSVESHARHAVVARGTTGIPDGGDRRQP